MKRPVRQPVRRPSRRQVRPNPKRMAALALLAVVAMLLGYGLASMIGTPEPDPTPPQEAARDADPGSPASATEPWYRTQPKPPELVTLPAEPLLPEESPGNGNGPRPYEEALPANIHPPPEPVPPQAARVPEADEPAPTVSPPAVTAPPPPPPTEAIEAPQPPRIEESDAPPYRRYAVAALPADTRPMIAIVIDDMGVDRKRSDQVVALPGPLTLSYLTYARDLPAQAEAARSGGHELMMHVSMEPVSGDVDPGPDVLRVGHDADTIRSRLHQVFDRFDGYVGINNHMGSRFTADAAGMAVVMEALKVRGLMFLDSRTSGRSVGAEMARMYGVPHVERNIFLDNENSVAAVSARLAEAERFARRHGYVIAIGHPRSATIRALQVWLPGLESRGFRLVPVTAILRRQTGQG